MTKAKSFNFVNPNQVLNYFLLFCFSISLLWSKAFYLFSIVLLFCSIYSLLSKKHKKEFPQFSLLFAILSSYTLAVAVSFFANGVERTAYFDYAFRFLAFFVVVFLYYKKDFQDYFRLGIVIALFLGIGSAAIKIIDLLYIKETGNIGRLTTIDANPINYADMVVVLGLLALNSCFTANRFIASQGLWRALCVFGFVFSIILSYLAQGKGSWLALPVGICIIVWRFLENRNIALWKSLVVSFLSLVVFALAFTQLKLVKTKLNHGLDSVHFYFTSYDPLVESYPSNSATFITRLEMWKVAWQTFLENPLVGVGPGNYKLALQGYVDSLTENTPPETKINGLTKLLKFDHAHNDFLHVLAERGILGFLAFFGAMAYFFAFFWKRRNYQFASDGLVFLSVFAIFLLTQSLLSHALTITFYYLMLGICYVGVRNEELRQPRLKI